MACTYTARGAFVKCMHSGGGELQRSSLASSIHAAAEAWAGCQCGSWAPVARGGTQEVGVSKSNYLWTNASETCRASPAALQAVSVFSVESFWAHPQSRLLGSVVALIM